MWIVVIVEVVNVNIYNENLIKHLKKKFRKCNRNFKKIKIYEN